MKEDAFDDGMPVEDSGTDDRAFVTQLRQSVGAIDVSSLPPTRSVQGKPQCWCATAMKEG